MNKIDFSIGYKKLCANYGTPSIKDPQRQQVHSDLFYDSFKHLSPEQWLHAVNICISHHQGRFPQVATIRLLLDQENPNNQETPSDEPDSPEIREMKRIDNKIFNLSKDNKRELLSKATQKAVTRLEHLSGPEGGVEVENGVTAISRAFLFTSQPIVRAAIMSTARSLYVKEFETPEPETTESPHSELGY